jgi:hypothetical protein
MADPSPKARNVYIDDELYEWLKQQAAAAGTTISQAIRDCIKLAKDTVEHPETGASK